MHCERFLEDYSDYCDGLLCAERQAEYREHLAACPGCARYDRVLRRGVELLRTLPGEGVDEEFMPRLVHNLYNVDEGLHPQAHRFAGGAALIGVAAVGLLALFWLPFAATVPLELELEPLAARAPVRTEPPALFGSGPFISAAAVEGQGLLDADVVTWPTRLHRGAGASPPGAIRLVSPRTAGR
jgi:anti-sigma factor RsiW